MSSLVSDSDIIDLLTPSLYPSNTYSTQSLGTITSSTLSYNPDSSPDNDVMSFHVYGKHIEFKGKEILRLKQMLDEWTKPKHPED